MKAPSRPLPLMQKHLAAWRDSSQAQEAMKSDDPYVAGKLRAAFDAGFRAGYHEGYSLKAREVAE